MAAYIKENFAGKFFFTNKTTMAILNNKSKYQDDNN